MEDKIIIIYHPSLGLSSLDPTPGNPFIIRNPMVERVYILPRSSSKIKSCFSMVEEELLERWISAPPQ